MPLHEANDKIEQYMWQLYDPRGLINAFVVALCWKLFCWQQTEGDNLIQHKFRDSQDIQGTLLINDLEIKYRPEARSDSTK